MADNHPNIEAEREFEAWWDKEGQYIRAGGGEYEKSFAYGAWNGRRTPVADGAAVDLPPLDEHRIIELWNSTESGGMMGRYIRFANAIAREAISHYLRKQDGQVGELPTKGEGNAGA